MRSEIPSTTWALFQIKSSRTCHVGNTSCHLNTEVKQHWVWRVLGWETAWELQVLLTKKQSRALLREHVSQADGWQTLSRCTGSGKAQTVIWTAWWWPLQSGSPEFWPLEWGLSMWILENGQILKKVMATKRSRSGLEDRRFKTWC